MFKIKPLRILAVLGLLVLVAGTYLGWQLYKGQQMANQYAEALTSPDGSSMDSASTGSLTPDSSGIIPTEGSDPTSPSNAADSGVVSSPSSTPSSEDYKQSMAKTYQQTLQTMHNVKANTLDLQNRKLSLSAYKASIKESQASFRAAEAFVRANPPADETLNPAYQEFLAGIQLANQSLDVVLKGLSSYNLSKLYAAREMGSTAQEQMMKAYSLF